jgi:DNA-binding PadR family transcriptional regulator
LTPRNDDANVTQLVADQPVPLRAVELHILLSVVDRPRHGYAILQEAGERTEGLPGFEIPTLYRALQRLRKAGLIRVVDPPERDVDERREYFEATPPGRRALKAELARMEVMVTLGRSRVGPLKAGGGK